MRWLVVEDALRDRQGHWFEYVRTFVQGLPELGDDVSVLAERDADPFILDQLHTYPVLPKSIWHRMGDGAGPLRRYCRVPGHAWQTRRALQSWFSKNGAFDVVFVPTVLVHHLLGWVWLLRRAPQLRKTRTILFFPNAPVRLNLTTGKPEWEPAPTSKLFRLLIRYLRSDVAGERVLLGVETDPMREALTHLTGVPFTYFPHPVAPLPPARERDAEAGGIVMGSYGGARHEKGSDCLVAAVDNYCQRFPKSRAQFVLQCVGGAKNEWMRLRGNPRVRLVPHYFASGEHVKHLAATDVLLLPYRRSSYALRVSRVVIEALVNGIPAIATCGTTLARQAEEFGAAVLCDDESPESLVAAIDLAERSFGELRRRAQTRMAAARDHFSVGKFRHVLSK